MAEDINNVKNELNKNIRDIEEKILKLINSKESKINEKLSNLNSKLKETTEKSNVTIENYSSQQLDHKKILEFEVFKNKADAMLITHEVRINNSIQDLMKFQGKYDKAIMDNLLLPGFIGPSCQFKNIGEYIYNTITEISKIKSDKEQIKKDTKDFKNKIDSIMKQMITLNDGSIERCTEYMDNKQKDIENMINGKWTDFNDKIKEIRVIISQFQNHIEGQINTFSSEITKILNMRSELLDLLEVKNEENKNFVNDVHKKVVLNIQDIGILKRKVNDMNEINRYYKRHSTKKIGGFLKRKDGVKSFQGIYNSNMINNIKNRVENNFFKTNDINSISAKTQNKVSEYVALNFDNIHEQLLNNNIFSINKNLNKMKKIEERSKENVNSKRIINDNIIKGDFIDNEKIIKTEYSSKNKNIIQKIKSNNKMAIKKTENKTKIKTESFDKLLMDSDVMQQIGDPFILDQKILSDNDLKVQKEKKAIKKEIIKKNLHKNLCNLRLISGSHHLDLYNYSTAMPKLSPVPKKAKNNININLQKKLNKIEDKQYRQESLKSIISNNDKISQEKVTNINNNFKLVTLELEKNASINPETNNGAYTLAQKLTENNKISKLNITPTSYVNVYDPSQKSSRLMNMTFAREEAQKI